MRRRPDEQKLPSPSWEQGPRDMDRKPQTESTGRKPQAQTECTGWKPHAQTRSRSLPGRSREAVARSWEVWTGLKRGPPPLPSYPASVQSPPAEHLLQSTFSRFRASPTHTPQWLFGDRGVRAGARESPGRPPGLSLWDPPARSRAWPPRAPGPPQGSVWACPRLPAGRILGRKEEGGRGGTKEGGRQASSVSERAAGHKCDHKSQSRPKDSPLGCGLTIHGREFFMRWIISLRHTNVSASTLEIRNMHISKSKGTYCTFLVDNVHLCVFLMNKAAGRELTFRECISKCIRNTQYAICTSSKSSYPV